MVVSGNELRGASREILYLDIAYGEPTPREREMTYPTFLDIKDADWGVLKFRSHLGVETVLVEDPQRNRNLHQDENGRVLSITFFEPHTLGVNIGGLPADPNIPTTLELQGFFALHEIRLAKKMA